MSLEEGVSAVKNVAIDGTVGFVADAAPRMLAGIGQSIAHTFFSNYLKQYCLNILRIIIDYSLKMPALSDAAQIHGLSAKNAALTPAIIIDNIRKYDEGYTAWRRSAFVFLQAYRENCSGAKIHKEESDVRTPIFLKIIELFLPILQYMIFPPSLEYRTPPTNLKVIDITTCPTGTSKVSTIRELYDKFTAFTHSDALTLLLGACSAAGNARETKKNRVNTDLRRICTLDIRSALRSVRYFFREEQTWKKLIQTGKYWAQPRSLIGLRSINNTSSGSIAMGMPNPRYICDLPEDEFDIAISEFKAASAKALAAKDSLQSVIRGARERYNKIIRSVFENGLKINNANQEITSINESITTARDTTLRQFADAHKAMVQLATVYNGSLSATFGNRFHEYSELPFRIPDITQFIADVTAREGFMKASLVGYTQDIDAITAKKTEVEAAIAEGAAQFKSMVDDKEKLRTILQSADDSLLIIRDNISNAKINYSKAMMFAFANTLEANKALADAKSKLLNAWMGLTLIKKQIPIITALRASYTEEALADLAKKNSATYKLPIQPSVAMKELGVEIETESAKMQTYYNEHTADYKSMGTNEPKIEAAIAEGAAVLTKLEEYATEVDTLKQTVLQAAAQAADMWYIQVNAEKAKNSAVTLANESMARSKAAANVAAAKAQEVGTLLQTLKQSISKIEALKVSYDTWFAEMTTKYSANDTFNSILRPKLDTMKTEIEKALKDVNEIYTTGTGIQELANSNASEAGSARADLVQQFKDAIDRAANAKKQRNNAAAAAVNVQAAKRKRFANSRKGALGLRGSSNLLAGKRAESAVTNMTPGAYKTQKNTYDRYEAKVAAKAEIGKSKAWRLLRGTENATTSKNENIKEFINTQPAYKQYRELFTNTLSNVPLKEHQFEKEIAALKQNEGVKRNAERIAAEERGWRVLMATNPTRANVLKYINASQESVPSSVPNAQGSVQSPSSVSNNKPSRPNSVANDPGSVSNSIAPPLLLAPKRALPPPPPNKPTLAQPSGKATFAPVQVRRGGSKSHKKYRKGRRTRRSNGGQ